MREPNSPAPCRAQPNWYFPQPAAQSSYSAERETMSWAYLYVTPLDPTRLTPKEIGKRAQP
jgi:hypothetical protein